MKTEHLQPRVGAAPSFYRVNILSLFPSLTPKLPATFLVLCPSLSSAIFLVEVYRKIVHSDHRFGHVCGAHASMCERHTVLKESTSFLCESIGFICFYTLWNEHRDIVS